MEYEGKISDIYNPCSEYLENTSMSLTPITERVPERIRRNIEESSPLKELLSYLKEAPSESKSSCPGCRKWEEYVKSTRGIAEVLLQQEGISDHPTWDLRKSLLMLIGRKTPQCFSQLPYIYNISHPHHFTPHTSLSTPIKDTTYKIKSSKNRLYSTDERGNADKMYSGEKSSHSAQKEIRNIDWGRLRTPKKGSNSISGGRKEKKRRERISKHLSGAKSAQFISAKEEINKGGQKSNKEKENKERKVGELLNIHNGSPISPLNECSVNMLYNSPVENERLSLLSIKESDCSPIPEENPESNRLNYSGLTSRNMEGKWLIKSLRGAKCQEEMVVILEEYLEGYNQAPSRRPTLKKVIAKLIKFLESRVWSSRVWSNRVWSRKGVMDIKENNIETGKFGVVRESLINLSDSSSMDINNNPDTVMTFGRYGDMDSEIEDELSGNILLTFSSPPRVEGLRDSSAKFIPHHPILPPILD